MKKYLINYLGQNEKVIKLVSTFILIGILFGIVIYNFLSDEVVLQLNDTCKDTLNIAKLENYNKISIIVNSCKVNLILLILIYISSLLIIAPPIISFIGTIKGISIGFYACNLISIFGVKNGIYAILCLLVIPNIIYIPTLIYTLTNSINFHFNITDKNILVTTFIKELKNIIISISLIFLSIIVEQGMTEIIINIWKNMQI